MNSSSVSLLAGVPTTTRVIKQRLVAYHSQTEPLSGYYSKAGILRKVDGRGTIEEVYERVRKILDEYK